MNKHPYGRLTTIKHGLVEMATGFVVVITLGEVQPKWVLSNAMNNALRHARNSGNPVKATRVVELDHDCDPRPDDFKGTA